MRKVVREILKSRGGYERELSHAHANVLTSENQYLPTLSMKELVILRGSRWCEEQSGFRTCSWRAISPAKECKDVHYADINHISALVSTFWSLILMRMIHQLTSEPAGRYRSYLQERNISNQETLKVFSLSRYQLLFSWICKIYKNKIHR